MATKLKHQQQQQQEQQGGGGNVVALNRCTAQGCTKKQDLMTFCGEHYEWFKFGLINKQGERPTDFDKKFMAFQKHKKPAA